MTAPALTRGFEVVIGLETHAQLSTASKIFSGASTQFGAAPNTQACAVDLALPGTLPVMNRGAVERAIQFGLAVGATVAPLSIFARKNYFYPDLPKGYQISQYEIPVVQGGRVDFLLGERRQSVRLTRAHLEEDAGKSLHEDFHGQTGIDLNRAGTPLLEIVTEPDMRSSAEAVAYAKALHAIVTWMGICDGNMQEGSFRCDANVSVRKPGAGAGHAARDQEPEQLPLPAAGDRLRGAAGRSTSMKTACPSSRPPCCSTPTPARRAPCAARKTRHDYRYFPDPDLPPLVIAPDWVERVRAQMPELPALMAERFVARRRPAGLRRGHDDAEPAAGALTTKRCATACGQPKLASQLVDGRGVQAAERRGNRHRGRRRCRQRSWPR
jgi:aspartyl-tRNA(Asn)/glutamyl-tRNA(Gln) amidotransferase subunit B